MMNSDKLNRIRKTFLYSFILFLSISALLAISSVLSGDFSDFEIKILLSTSIIALASICALCCSAYMAKRKRIITGMIGISIAAISAILLLLGVWAEIYADEYWQTAAIFSVFAIAFAHCLALMAVELDPGKIWLKAITTINIFVLAFILSALIIEGDFDGETMKSVAVLAILASLETLVIPILGRMVKSAPREVPQAKETITLTKIENELYEDRTGKVYRLEEVKKEKPIPLSNESQRDK